MAVGSDVIPRADHALSHGASLSFDKGFTREEDRPLLGLSIPEGVMPKRGKKNAAETERESGKKFAALRKQHRAVESEINRLEHHGLNRCLDVGLAGYLRYAGLGVMSYHLPVIGRELLARPRARGNTLSLAAGRRPNETHSPVRPEQCRHRRKMLAVWAWLNEHSVTRRPSQPLLLPCRF